MAALLTFVVFVTALNVRLVALIFTLLHCMQRGIRNRKAIRPSGA